MASFWTGYAWPTVITVGEVLAVVVPLLLAIAYLTHAGRKVLALSQLRKGPNVVGPLGRSSMTRCALDGVISA
jgi:NADH-quinone oxidoreductase subunit H